MDFFDTTCQEPPISDSLFGICDDADGTKAYTDRNNPDSWVAIVKNNRNVVLTFTAIDNCVILGNQEPDRGRCDGMLTSIEHLFFVELKDKKRTRSGQIVEQLESTIKFFLENHDASVYKHKKAFACNKNCKFQTVENEISKYFFNTYKFRIDIQSTILII
jgi:hypothetical protein